MRSAKNSKKVLSALSMAAAATMGAKAAHGVTLNLYYGQESSYANSNNGAFIGTGFSRTAGTTDAQGEGEGLKTTTTNTVTGVTLSNSGVTTITIPVGGYLSLAIDAVLTGNPNLPAYVGLTTGQSGIAQPSYLGLSELGLAVSSSDATGALLTPLSQLPAGSPDATIDGIPSYTSTTNVQQKIGANGGTSIAPAPSWPAVLGPGEVQPNLTGYDTAPNSNGGVGFDHTSGIAAFTAGGNKGPLTANTTAGYNAVAQFTTQNNTASYAAATDFADNIFFRVLPLERSPLLRSWFRPRRNIGRLRPVRFRPRAASVPLSTTRRTSRRRT